MLITQRSQLQRFTTENRLWQGIPGIAVTKKGRIFATFYSGGITEQIGNFVPLVMSEDGGETFSEPIAVAFKENGYRCYDPTLWIDPLGRLWFIWSIMPEHATYAAVCDDPDAETPVWSQPRRIGNDVMMNKPTVLTTGEWLFPIAVWAKGLWAGNLIFDSANEDRRAFVYRTVDNGETFEKLGGTAVDKRGFDEHMVLELKDGRLAMFVRTFYGIGVSYSYDRGRTWTKGTDSGLGGPCSRFSVSRLPSGRILLINHVNFTGRNNLTALLSEDEGRTWPYRLLLDERANVSYPDVAKGPDGSLYIAYDRERGSVAKSLDELYGEAREILYAKITEEDILAGKLVSPGSRLKCIISKLGRYAHEDENPYQEADRFTPDTLAARLLEKYPNRIVEKIFEYYAVNCANMHRLEFEKFDALAARLEREEADHLPIVEEMIILVRAVTETPVQSLPIVETVKKIIMENITLDLSAAEIAKKAGISLYYMMHLFKKVTGTTITEYKHSLKITCAKDLLVHTDKTVTEVARECGFDNSSYFANLFRRSEGVSPTAYRTALGHKKP